MQSVAAHITNIFDQLDPFSEGNIALFFAWLVVFTFTTVAIWRAPWPWFRLVCFAANQCVSVGVLMSWTLTVLLAYTFWQSALAVLVGTAGASFLLFRRCRRRG